MRGIQVSEYLKVDIISTIPTTRYSFSPGTHQTPEGLKVSDLPDPVPKKDEYLIRVQAAATNFFDILQVQGKYQNQPRTYINLPSDDPRKQQSGRSS
jgi:hypothetical protein